MSIIGISDSWETLRCPNCLTRLDYTRVSIDELEEAYVKVQTHCSDCKRTYVKTYFLHTTNRIDKE